MKIPFEYIVNVPMLSAQSLYLTIKLLEVKENSGINEFHINHQKLMDLVGVRSNDTFKKILHEMYDHFIINEKVEVLNRDSHLLLSFTDKFIDKIDARDSYEIPKDTLATIWNNEVKYCKLLIYLQFVNSHQDFINPLFNSAKAMQKNLGISNKTLSQLKKELSANGITWEYSISNKDNFLISDKLEYVKDEDHLMNSIFPVREEDSFSEAKLERKLIKDLNVIEVGMQLIKNQFEIKNGMIDILAKDKEGRICIIELKIVSNDEKLVFQSVYYPTQILGNPRMITIAPSYDYKIKTCLDRLEYVEMKTYRLEKGKIIIE